MTPSDLRPACPVHGEGVAWCAEVNDVVRCAEKIPLTTPNYGPGAKYAPIIFGGYATCGAPLEFPTAEDGS